MSLYGFFLQGLYVIYFQGLWVSTLWGLAAHMAHEGWYASTAFVITLLDPRSFSEAGHFKLRFTQPFDGESTTLTGRLIYYITEILPFVPRSTTWIMCRICGFLFTHALIITRKRYSPCSVITMHELSLFLCRALTLWSSDLSLKTHQSRRIIPRPPGRRLFGCY